jgi:hypothetical protein
MTPETWADGLGDMVSDGRVRGQGVLCFVLALVKCTRIYFFGAKDAPCLQAHSKQRSWTVCSILQFSSVVWPNARVFMSLRKLMLEDGEVCCLQASTRLAL